MFKKLFAPAPEKKYTVLLYGLQRSGTNYLRTLLQLNYPEIVFQNSDIRNDPAHKHFRLYDAKDRIPEPQFYNMLQSENLIQFESHLQNKPEFYLIVSKDPYSWYVSYMKWAEKNKWPKPGYHYIEEWNLFYGKWLLFAKENQHILFVQYAALLKDPALILKRIAGHMQIPLKENIRTAGKVYASARFSKADKAYYTENQFLEKIPPSVMKEINAKLDREVVKQLHYAVIGE